MDHIVFNNLIQNSHNKEYCRIVLIFDLILILITAVERNRIFLLLIIRSNHSGEAKIL